MDNKVFNSTSHIKVINETILELKEFSQITAAPAPLTYQYIGTVVDNTLALLTVPLNSLTGQGLFIRFDNFENWLSLMLAVHTSFLSSIHIFTEKGLYEICKEQGIEVQPSFGKNILSEIEEIERINENNEINEHINNIKEILMTNRPSFDDYLNSVLRAITLPKKTKTIWRKFFLALSTVRNKCSHSDTSLNEREKTKLREGGFSALISPIGDLQINTSFYPQIIKFILDFFDLISEAKLEK